MTSFIKDVLKDLKAKNTDFSKPVFILPSKRAGIILRNELSEITSKTFFAPQIISIEEFVEDLSNLKSLTNIELLFIFYKVYTEHTNKETQESFDAFSKWAQILLQDFNEIDRYLIDSDRIFNYLNEIQKLNHWSLEENQTDFTKNYLKFWSQLNLYYQSFTKKLINLGVGYQGLIYREAVENIENYLQYNNSKQHVFIGFNALNKSESIIIQELLQNGVAQVFWDIDKSFINTKIHEAAAFINSHKSNWSYYKTNAFNWISNNYTSKKNITVIGTPQNISQAKLIGELLETQKNKNSLASTAVILGDETLLIPVLNSLPENINTLNITMGFPLKDVPLASLFNQLFLMQKHHKSLFYFKDVIALLSHQFIQPLFQKTHSNSASELIAHIQQNNLVYLTETKLQSLIATEDKQIISLLFSNWQNSPEIAISHAKSIIIEIKNNYQSKQQNALALEYLYRFHEIFNVLQDLNTKYKSITSISVLHGLYKEILTSETLDFKGEPLQGLQIMGMLESRVLDFETVIISSVNEGVLPSGKSNNSFIPFDVKLENELPTYKEKDAVYTYHFYRLLQRAKNVFIIYNTEVDAINGGEKSRFITQLEIEKIHDIKHKIVSPKNPIIEKKLEHVSKDNSIIVALKEIASNGFSPSSLTTYIRNPIDFYCQKILRINENDNVEETVAANTLGTVIHNTLEDFYKPLENKELTINAIKSMLLKINTTVKHHFLEVYKQGDISRGKNLIIFEIAKRYVSNFLNLELESVKNGNNIKIISIESEFNIPIKIEELGFDIKLKGKVDRVDEFNGTTRIIDYKTGRVEQNRVEIVNWEDITTDYNKYSKSFQVLCYALMMSKITPFSNNVEAGIISFKNLKSGFLKFSKKDKEGRGAQKNSLITQEILSSFEFELKKLILEIFNPEKEFVENEL